jgi:hypothetical protein
MQRLIIHVKDSSTDFLCPIYSHLQDTTIVRTPLRPQLMNELINAHDQVIMLGHGCPQGLFSNNFRSYNPYIIGAANAEALSKKDNNIFIWCYASSFVRNHNLRGFSTSMFISEDGEARVCLPPNVYTESVDEHAVDEQNYLFARLVGENISKDIETLYAKVKRDFCDENIVADNKSVINYNRNGLILFK